MNILPYKYFIYLNYLLFVSLLLATWWLLSKATSFNIFLTVVSLITLTVLLVSKEKHIPKIQLISTRIVLLVVFVASVWLSFAHFFFTVDNSWLILITLCLPAVSLISLVLVDTNHN